jgi:diguanylate cyclase (GGDEF)-like protein
MTMHRTQRTAVAIVATAMLASPGSGLAMESVRFEHLTVQDGLSQGHVGAIIQDHLGYIWLGTQDGLHRFDGHELVVHKHDPRDPRSLADSFVHDLAVDADGVLWIATDQGGLHRANPATGAIDRLDWGPESTSGLPSPLCNVLLITQDGALWIGLREGGLCQLRAGASRFECLQDQAGVPLGSGNVGVLMQRRSGELWVALTDRGIARLDPETGKLIDEGLVPGSIEGSVALLEDSLGRVWAGTFGEGLFRFQGQSMEPVVLDPDVGNQAQITISLLQARDGTIWIGTSEDGLLLLDPATERVRVLQHDPHEPSSVVGNAIRTLYQDPAGGVWVGSSGSGLSRYSPFRFKFGLHRIGGGGNASFVYAITEASDGSLWSGGGGPGLVRHHRDTGQITVHPVNVGDTRELEPGIMALLPAPDGDLWVGSTHYGLMRYHADTDRYEVLQEEFDLHSLAPAVDGLWLGTVDRGLVHYHTGTGAWQAWDDFDGLTSPDTITSLLVDHAGALWIGTARSGLFRHVPGSERFEHHTALFPGQELASDAVLSLYEDPAQRIWVGTRSGLSRMDRTAGVIHSWYEGAPLPNGVIYGILPDDRGQLWISSNKGLIRFHPETAEIVHYTQADGLQNDEFNRGAHHRSANGELFFGGVSGISSFRPGELRSNPDPPRLALTSYRLFNGESQAVPHDGLHLSYLEHAFDIEFAALDYAAPGRNRYSYKLDDYDPDWSSPSTRRTASWTRVPPGDYTLRLRASNSDGVWTPEGEEHTLPVTIVPPPWRRLPVQALSAALVALLAIVAAVARMVALGRQRDALAREVERRTAELETLARTDPLTGVANRRQLMEQGRAEIARAVRQGSSMALLMMDLDRFKRINDQLGHPAGDLALRALVRDCGEILRPFDTLGRVGGDEFVVLLPNADAVTALRVAGRIRVRLQARGSTPPLTVSIGVVALRDDENLDSLLLRADQALLEAKQRGRDQAVLGG